MATILMVICITFFVTNLSRVFLNLYESYYVNISAECGANLIPSTWVFCTAAVNHLLLVLNSFMNFFIYCFLNEDFRKILSSGQTSNSTRFQPDSQYGRRISIFNQEAVNVNVSNAGEFQDDPEAQELKSHNNCSIVMRK